MRQEMKKFIIKRIIRGLGFDVALHNILNTRYKKNALLVYILDPYIYGSMSNVHQAFEQVKIIAKLLSEFGNNVDVIDYRANKIRLNKKYDVVFDIRIKSIPIYNKYIDENTKRIAYLTESEPEFANSAEIERVRDINKRRGIELAPRRQAPLIDQAVERCDLVIMIGNEYNFATYNKYHLAKTAIVPNTGYKYDFSFDKNKKKSTSFVYLGSAGAIHKGLDLLLEVFSELGEPYKLYVCGYYEREKDFVKAYVKELYNTSNIVPIGFVDIKSNRFKNLSEECCFTILPSCAEGCAGSVATCMSAGIIPICSRNCGYEEDEVIILDDCKKETIKRAIIEASNMRILDIEKKSCEVVELTKTKYCLDNYTKLMREALTKVLY